MSISAYRHGFNYWVLVKNHVQSATLKKTQAVSIAMTSLVPGLLSPPSLICISTDQSRSHDGYGYGICVPSRLTVSSMFVRQIFAEFLLELTFIVSFFTISGGYRNRFTHRCKWCFGRRIWDPGKFSHLLKKLPEEMMVFDHIWSLEFVDKGLKTGRKRSFTTNEEDFNIYILIQYIWYRIMEKSEESLKPWKPSWKGRRNRVEDIVSLLYGDVHIIVENWSFQFLFLAVESIYWILNQRISIDLNWDRINVIQQRTDIWMRRRITVRKKINRVDIL